MTFYWDKKLLVAVLALLAVGLVMVASASMVIADAQHGYPYFFVLRQAAFMGLGLVLLWLLLGVGMARWQACAKPLLLFGLVLLAAVLLPGLGHTVNGSTRWLRLGPINVQVSEVIKLVMIVYLADYLARFQGAVRGSLRAVRVPISILVVITVLMLLEPDFGDVAVLIGVVIAQLWIAGLRLRHFCFAFLAMGLSLVGLILVAPYRMARLTGFLHPWSHQFDSGYQLTQALMAFGRGGIWGVGLGNSLQKLFYLPEAHTDFLFAVLAEETGLVGQCVVLALYGVVMVCGFATAQRALAAEQLFEGYLSFGLTLWLGLQTLVNIGVNMGVLPTKGLTLPLLSYGGSSLLINCVVVAMLLRAYHETVIQRAGSASA